MFVLFVIIFCVLFCFVWFGYIYFCERTNSNGCGTAKVAEFEAVVTAEDVLELDVAVCDGRHAAVHVRHGLAHLEEDREHLRLRERPVLAETLVQDVQERAPRAQLHHNDRLLPPLHGRGERALHLDDVLVP